MPFDTAPKRLGFAGSSPAALSLAFAAACFVATGLVNTKDTFAQQTVIIGGGPPAQPVSGGVRPSTVGSGVLPSTVGSGAGGIVVNNSVLDSLGPGPSAGLPMAAPQTPVYGAGIATPGASGSYTNSGASGSYASSGGAAGAYRAPGTGQLVVTRPSTLLHPPIQAPKSRLAVAPVRSAAIPKPAQPARAGKTAAPSGKLSSRLIAAPPKKRPAVPATPKAAAAAPKAAKPQASKPAKTASVAAKPSIQAPAAPSQTAAKPPAAAIQIAPKVQAPSAPPAAPKAPSVPAPTVKAPKIKAPSVPAPTVAAPAIPSAPTAKPAETTVAAIPPAKEQAVAPPGGDLRLTFTSGSAELTGPAKKQLETLAQGLAKKSSMRVQLLAFAADSGGGASRARRLSLSRALAVRAFLIDKGVRSTRMDVRALGSKAGDGPADRVDILPQ